MDVMEARRRLLMQAQDVPPVGYRWIEYAENRTRNYVQLPYGFDPSDVIEIKGSLDASQNGEHWLVGSRNPWNDNINRFSMLGSSSSKFCCTFGTQGSPNDKLIPVHSTDSDVHIATYANRVFQMTDLGTTMDVSGYSFGGTTSALALFRGYANCQGRIYYYKQTKQDGTKLDIKPVKNISTGEVEMYDTVSKTIMPRFGTLYPPT
jgi:hypothetical protein